MPINITAVVMFFIFVAITLGITYWASSRSQSRSQFYAASGGLTGWQNGIAFTGEFLSAATILGITALYYAGGFDGLIYAIGALMGWPVILFLLSDKLRAMGKFTLTDVLSYRLKEPSLRVFATVATVVVLLLYMVAQLVGAGALVELLFGIDFFYAVCVIGVLMMIYVIFGGMVATSWVQIIKCCFLLVLGCILAFGVLAKFDFSIGKVLATAVEKHPLGIKILGPISLSSPAAAISAFLTQAVGLAGLPHLIMRFFTVPSVAEARRSANFATALIGLFYILMIVIGFGAVAILTGNPDYVGPTGALRNGVNMAPLYLAHSIGGDLLLGICAAALFATILAVVAGLTLAVAAAVSHDLYAGVIKKGTQTEAQEMRVSRFAAVTFSVVSILLSVAFRHENITFLVVTALSIAASSTFPVLFLTVFWRGTTAAGAVIGGSVGLVGALAAIILGPTVWVPVFGNAAPIFPYQYPTVVTLPLSLVLIVVVSLLSQKSAAAVAPARP